MRQIVLLVCSLILSGCSVFGIPTTELYAGRFDSVESFIASNFKPTLSILLDNDSEALKADGVVWRAHFNASSTGYISKPFKDIKTYCSSKGGELNKLGFEHLEIVQGLLYEHSPLSAYYNSGAEALKNGESGEDANAGAWLAFKERLKRKIYSEFVQVSQEKILAAAHAGELGAFACEVEGRKKWVAVIDFVSATVSVGAGYPTPVANIRIKGSSNIL